MVRLVYHWFISAFNKMQITLCPYTISSVVESSKFRQPFTNAAWS